MSQLGRKMNVLNIYQEFFSYTFEGVQVVLLFAGFLTSFIRNSFCYTQRIVTVYIS